MKVEPPGERFESDTAIDRAWRSTSIEEPEARLDATILAAADAEVAKAVRRLDPVAASGARHSRDLWLRWQPLAAAAAVAGLAFVLVQTIPRDHGAPPGVSLENSQPQADAASPDPRVSPPAELERPAAGRSPSLAPARSEPPAFAVPRSPEAAAPPATPVESRVRHPEAEAGRPAAALAAQDENVASGATATAKASEARLDARARESMLPPDEWAARIAALHAAGDADGAARELRAFRSAYGPEEVLRHLPDTLRPWASGVE